MFLNTSSATASEFLAVWLPVDQRETYHQMAEPVRFTTAALSAPFLGPPSLLHPRSGITELMRAVLEDAIYCFNLEAEKTTRTRRLVREAQAWFSSDDERWPFAFVNVCRALGLDPASVRRTLRRGHDQATSAPPRKKRMEASRRRPLHCAA